MSSDEEVEDDDDDDDGEVELLLLLLLLSLDARDPVPHMTVSPSDCSLLVGVVLAPLAEAMVNRVVHVGLALFLSVN